MSEFELAMRYTHAVARMLLGHKMLKPGAALLAGGPIDVFKRVKLVKVASDSGSDLVHLTFEHGADGYRFTGLHLCASRGNAVYVYPECRLASIGRRTIILPPAGHGHFVLAPGELIYKPSRPAGWQKGLALAERRLRTMVSRGVTAKGQILVHRLDGPEVEPA